MTYPPQIKEAAQVLLAAGYSLRQAQAQISEQEGILPDLHTLFNWKAQINTSQLKEGQTIARQHLQRLIAKVFDLQETQLDDWLQDPSKLPYNLAVTLGILVDKEIKLTELDLKSGHDQSMADLLAKIAEAQARLLAERGLSQLPSPFRETE